jgi:hypothetical protein
MYKQIIDIVQCIGKIIYNPGLKTVITDKSCFINFIYTLVKTGKAHPDGIKRDND